MLLGSFSIVGIGMIAAILPLLYVERGDQMVFVIQSIILLFSGVYYAPETLPDWMQVVGLFSPGTYVLEGIRGGLIDGLPVTALLNDVWPLVVMGAILILFLVRERGFTQTLFGRKTHFPNISSRQQNLRQGSERAAINAPIQGTSADLIKRAMARMDRALAAAGLDGVRMLLQVHDELVFEVPDGREEEAAGVIKTVMGSAAEPAIELDVPLDVEVGWGRHWGAAH